MILHNTNTSYKHKGMYIMYILGILCHIIILSAYELFCGYILQGIKTAGTNTFQLMLKDKRVSCIAFEILFPPISNMLIMESK
jgi:hypothetical protein